MRKEIATFLALVFCMAAPHCFAQGTPVANQQGQTRTIFSFKSEIGLSDDQEIKLKALLYDEQTFMDTNNAALKNLGAQLTQMIQNKADMQAIKTKLEELAQMQVGISYRNIEDSRKVATILTPAQFEKWRDIQKEFSPRPST